MAEHSIVLGGWGMPPEVLRPVFGRNARYIDSNMLLPHLVDNDTLVADWPRHVATLLSPYLSPHCVLAGWSTGAMLAYGAATVLSPEATVCISATPSFCRTAEFRHGMRASVLSKMAHRLEDDSTSVLDEFALGCGLSSHPMSAASRPWTPAQLSDGLSFLAQARLTALPVPESPLYFIHGTDDRIIPPAAGEWFSEHCNASFSTVEGPHACFTGASLTMKSICLPIHEGTDHESF